MAVVFDHLGISVLDLRRGIARFDPIMQALGFGREDADDSVAWWREGEPEFILYPVRDGADTPHVHGRAGWQHLAFAVDSRAEVDRLHAIALDAGWAEVRAPKTYPRFNERYYASFIEDESGIRLEFMHNPPRPA
ncbi:MAG: VOC family protein [Microbacterium sp.]